MSEQARRACEAICNEIAQGGPQTSEEIIDGALAGMLQPPHKCKRIASAVMDMDRDWWIGELLEPVSQWPKETHCLHMKTPIKDVSFLCNAGDFEQLIVLSNAVVELQNLDWLRSMTQGAKDRGGMKGKLNDK
jgi:hypothetical protein